MTRLLPPLSIPTSTPIETREALRRIDQLITPVALRLLADNPPEALRERAAQYAKDNLAWLSATTIATAHRLELDPRLEAAYLWHATTKSGLRKFQLSLFAGMVREAAMRAKTRKEAA